MLVVGECGVGLDIVDWFARRMLQRMGGLREDFSSLSSFSSRSDSFYCNQLLKSNHQSKLAKFSIALKQTAWLWWDFFRFLQPSDSAKKNSLSCSKMENK